MISFKLIILVTICLTLISLVYYASLTLFCDPDFIIFPEETTFKFYDESRMLAAYNFTSKISYTFLVPLLCTMT